LQLVARSEGCISTFNIVELVKKMSNTTIGVRITKDDRDLLDWVCKARGEDLSDFVRRAIKMELAKLSFYTKEEKKALGVDSN
jgi:uncharacterized protein (DUF1778 family)